MKAIVANRLIDGEVVYWNAGAWKARFGEAELFDADEAAEEAVAKANVPTSVVDCYLIDVEPEGGTFTADGQYFIVNLQDNNAYIVFDVTLRKYVRMEGYGYKEMTMAATISISSNRRTSSPARRDSTT